MTTERLHPSTLFDTTGFAFSHIAVQSGGRTAHIAGQTAWDKDMQLVGGDDVGLQARQALVNITAALAAVGATPADVVRLRTYVVASDGEALGKVTREIDAFYAGATPAPNTFLGISALAVPEFLIEIEATAALD